MYTLWPLIIVNKLISIYLSQKICLDSDRIICRNLCGVCGVYWSTTSDQLSILYCVPLWNFFFETQNKFLHIHIKLLKKSQMYNYCSFCRRIVQNWDKTVHLSRAIRYQQKDSVTARSERFSVFSMHQTLDMVNELNTHQSVHLNIVCFNCFTETLQEK